MTEPRRLGDRYELGEVLGYGGMAEVHRGRDVRLGRDVAIKTLRVDLARELSSQSRFRREAQSAASLNHPAIVAVYDTGEDTLDGVTLPYIVMEYVDGRTLRDVLRTEHRIMPTRALEITAEILKALDYSHRGGIIHRDIKPGNVMLTRGGAVKVMDFGIARALSQGTATVTQTAAVIGTAQYLSPEQARGEQVDARSDVYSTGCLLYELLTGTPPFTGDSAVAIAYQHVREDPVPPSQVNPDVSPAIDAIVLKAMAKNPANRYQSAAEMREDIERALAGAPVQATPVLAPAERTTMMARVEEAPARRQPRGRRSLVYTLLGIAAIAIVVAVVLLVKNYVSDQHGPANGTVPTVVSMSEDQAVQVLKQAGYNPVIQQGASSKVAKGLVYDQNPPANTPQVTGTSVTIYVSTGPKLVKVPDLTGKLLDDAKETLAQSGLTLGTTTNQDSQTTPGTVLSQNPTPGQSVMSGGAVNVVVASGNGTVPDVRSYPVDEAESTLTGAGYQYNVVQTPDSNVAAGTVINTSPGHDTKAKIGSTVTIYEATTPVSSPPPTPTTSGSSPATTPPASPGT